MPDNNDNSVFSADLLARATRDLQGISPSMFICDDVPDSTQMNAIFNQIPPVIRVQEDQHRIQVTPIPIEDVVVPVPTATYGHELYKHNMRIGEPVETDLSLHNEMTEEQLGESMYDNYDVEFDDFAHYLRKGTIIQIGRGNNEDLILVCFDELMGDISDDDYGDEVVGQLQDTELWDGDIEDPQSINCLWLHRNSLTPWSKTTSLSTAPLTIKELVAGKPLDSPTNTGVE